MMMMILLWTQGAFFTLCLTMFHAVVTMGPGVLRHCF
jgi:hypothetical protein